MRKTILVLLFFIFTSLGFFYPILRGEIPFPGDLLVGNYGPYNSNTYFGYQPGGVPNKAQGPDVIRQLLPWKKFAIETYRSGQVPFWNSYNLSGNPLMANFQSGVFYPLNIIFFADFLSGWTLFILLIPILSAFFTYRFLREIDVGSKASIFGGLVFAFSSYMTVWMEYGNVGHTFLWLPLGLYFAEKLAKKITKITFFLLILTLTFSFLAGYIQTYFYIFITLIFYFTLRSLILRTLNWKTLILFFSATLYPLLIGAFQLIPTLELFTFSARNNYSLSEIDKILNPFWYSITTIIPNFFGNPATRNTWFYGTYIERVSYFGFVPFIFAILAILNFRKKKEVIIFTLIFVASFILATNLFFNKFLYLLPIPVISTTIPTRILSIFVFSGSILSAFGFDFFLKNYNGKLNKILLFLSVFFVLLWAVLIGLGVIVRNTDWLQNIAIAKRNLTLPTGLLIFFSLLNIFNYKTQFKFKTLILIAIFALTIFDLFYFFHKITPFSPKEYAYPKTEVFNYLKDNASIYRVWGYGSGAIENNFQTYEKIYSTDGYEPLQIKRYGELLSTSKEGEIDVDKLGSDANLVGGFGSDDLRENQYRQRLMNLLGVKYIIHKNDFLVDFYDPDYSTFPKEDYALIWQKSPLQIYENKKALPRIFLVSNYIVEKDKEKIIEMLLNKDFVLRDKIILEEDPELDLGEDGNAKVNMLNYTANKVELITSSKANMLLFISDNYYPGWDVSIDGQFAKIYRADYAFRAVVVPKGEHSVNFNYYPSSFNLGLWISALAILNLVSIGFISNKND